MSDPKPEIKGVKAFDMDQTPSSANITPANGAKVAEKSIKGQLKDLGNMGAQSAKNAAEASTAGVVSVARSGIANLKGTIAKIGTTMKSGMLTMGSAVGKVLAVGPVAGSIIGALSLTMALGVPAAAMWDSTNHNADQIARYTGDIEDCTEQVAEKKALYGKGDIVIPEEYNGYKVGYVNEYEGHFDVIDEQLHISEGSDMHRVYDLWIEHGRQKSDSGVFDTLDNYYFAAVAPDNFGRNGDVAHVGDHITFYFDNGMGIDVIIADVKSSGDSNFCEWGHIEGSDVKVLEFLGFSSAGGDACKQVAIAEGWDTIPTRVASATNHGPADVYVEKYGGGAGEAVGGAQSAAKSKAIKSAQDDCYSTRKNSGYDNSGIAESALSFAYTLKKDGDPNATNEHQGTALYKKLCAAIVPGDQAVKSCDTTVCVAVRWSGSDDDIPAHNADGIAAYCKTSPRWEYVGTFPPGDTSQMQPGDVLHNATGGHVAIYVSNEMVVDWPFSDEQRIPQAPKPLDGYDCVAGSYHHAGGDGWNGAGCAPGVSHETSWMSCDVFRCVNPANSDMYAAAAEG